MLSEIYSNWACLAESVAFRLADLLLRMCGLVIVRMATGLELQRSLTGFSLVSLGVLVIEYFFKAPRILCLWTQLSTAQ